jgi:hypothetical protein
VRASAVLVAFLLGCPFAPAEKPRACWSEHADWRVPIFFFDSANSGISFMRERGGCVIQGSTFSVDAGRLVLLEPDGQRRYRSLEFEERGASIFVTVVVNEQDGGTSEPIRSRLHCEYPEVSGE